MKFQKNKVLFKVKQYINYNLNPNKQNILNPMNDKFEQYKQDSFTTKYNMDDYYKCLSISSDFDYQINLKQEPNACFVNNSSRFAIMGN